MKGFFIVCVLLPLLYNSEIGSGYKSARCVDKFPTLCRRREKKGDCDKPTKTVRDICQKTCKLFTSCKDDKPECKAFAAAKLCKGERKIMRKYCKKSCKVCF